MLFRRQVFVRVVLVLDRCKRTGRLGELFSCQVGKWMENSPTKWVEFLARPVRNYVKLGQGPKVL